MRHILDTGWEDDIMILNKPTLMQLNGIYSNLPCPLKRAIQALIVVAGTGVCTFLEILILHYSLTLLDITFLILHIDSPLTSYLLYESNQIISILSIILWTFQIIAYKLSSTYKEITDEISNKTIETTQQKFKDIIISIKKLIQNWN